MSDVRLASPVRTREILAGESLRDFIELSWQINRRDPNWVPPLRMSVRAALDRRKHPFHRHAEVAYFVAERAGRPVGRIAAIVNRRYNDFHDENTGFFGLVEAEDDRETTAALFEVAASWLAERGMVRMRGPFNFTTNDEIGSPGILVDGFSSRPMIMMSHNPPYYGPRLEEAGLVGSKDLLAFYFDNSTHPQRGARSLDRILARENATIRPLDLKRFSDEVAILKEIYNDAWSRNWGFVPMTDAEFDHLAKEFRPVVDPDLCLIAEVRGEPVGFSLALPDLNHALRHLPDGRLFPFGIFKLLWHRRRIRGMRVLTLGFKSRYRHSGLGPAFYLRTWQAGLDRGYDHGEASWILEDNHDMIRPLERMGGRVYRRYRIYEKPL
jgi:hypothetical protein